MHIFSDPMSLVETTKKIRGINSIGVVLLDVVEFGVKSTLTSL